MKEHARNPEAPLPDSADGGSIRIGEREIVSEPAVIPTAGPPGARKPRQTGARSCYRVLSPLKKGHRPAD